MSTLYLGIDPGTTGCLASLTENNEALFYDTPASKAQVGKKTKTVYDIQAMISLLRGLKARADRVVCMIEELHAMPKNGGVGNFSSGFGYGLWMALLASEGITHHTVQPSRWKKALGLKSPGPDVSDSAKKSADRLFACQLFPLAASEMSLGKHHGRADSLLIAEYGRRLYTGANL